MLDANLGQMALTQSFFTSEKSEEKSTSADWADFVAFFWSSSPIKELKEKLQLPSSYQSNNFLFALIHQSFIHENSHLGQLQSLQRLEFLGDSVLSLVIAEELYQRHRDSREGELTKRKGMLVNASALAELAMHLQLQRVLLVGKGVVKTFARSQERILADCFEALLGALYLDFGLDKIRNLVHSLQEQQPQSWQALSADTFDFKGFDPKSRLQEKVLEMIKELPVYQQHETADGVLVEIFMRQQKLAGAQAPSKREAEKLAAQMALDILETNIKTNETNPT